MKFSTGTTYFTLSCYQKASTGLLLTLKLSPHHYHTLIWNPADYFPPKGASPSKQFSYQILNAIPMSSMRAASSVPLAALRICIKFDYLINRCTVHTHSRNPAGFIKILSVRRPHPTRVTNGLLKSQQTPRHLQFMAFLLQNSYFFCHWRIITATTIM